MKQLIMHILILTLAAAGAFAADAWNGQKGDIITLSGTIVDNRCAEAHQGALKQFIKSHTKECALMPECAASGYSLYHYGALIPFDGSSSKKIEAFLKKKESGLNVVVEVKKNGDTYTLISIKNK